MSSPDLGSGLHLVLLGPPGAGKGTQAERLATAYGVPHISTGNLFREHLDKDTPLGREARQYIDAGRLVPDAVTEAMVGDRLDRPDAGGGAIFDGFPRTIPQTAALDQMLEGRGWKLTAVTALDVPPADLITRLTGRRTCSKCQASYHVVFQPPKVPDVCDRCGGRLVQRPDDSEATVAERLRVYERQTAPLIGHYRPRGLLLEVSGDGPVEEVTSRIMNALAAHAGD